MARMKTPKTFVPITFKNSASVGAIAADAAQCNWSMGMTAGTVMAAADTDNLPAAATVVESPATFAAVTVAKSSASWMLGTPLIYLLLRVPPALLQLLLL